ncbi:MAG TPA: site-specific integrase, partial [Lachnospiraceae bacterium]
YTRTLLKLLDKDILVDRLNANTIKTAFYKKSNPGTYNERLTRFKAFIRWAYENDYVKDIHWIDKLKALPNPEKNQKLKNKYLEKKELHTLLDAMDIKVWHQLTQLMVLSGIRVGEAMALERNNFDFKARLIYIDKTLDHINKATNSPKTFTSKRQVYMQKELYHLCNEIYQESLNNNLRYGHSSPLLFADENGNYVNYYSYNKYLKENSQVCLGRSISTHILRHTHTSLMAEAGVSLEAISRRLGHANSRVTRDIYLHITSRQKERDNAEFENVGIL